MKLILIYFLIGFIVFIIDFLYEKYLNKSTPPYEMPLVLSIIIILIWPISLYYMIKYWNDI